MDKQEALLDDLLRAKLAEALADPRPPIPLAEAVDRIRASLRAR